MKKLKKIVLILALCTFSGLKINAMNYNTYTYNPDFANKSDGSNAPAPIQNYKIKLQNTLVKKDGIDAQGLLYENQKAQLDDNAKNFENIYSECIQNFYDLQSFILLNFRMQPDLAIVAPTNFFNDDEFLTNYIYYLSFFFDANLRSKNELIYNQATTKILNFYNNISKLRIFLNKNLPDYFPDSLYTDLKEKHFNDATKNYIQALTQKFTDKAKKHKLIINFTGDSTKDLSIMHDTINNIATKKLNLLENKKYNEEYIINLQNDINYLRYLSICYMQLSEYLSPIHTKLLKKRLDTHANTAINQLKDLKEICEKNQIKEFEEITSKLKERAQINDEVLKAFSNNENINKDKKKQINKILKDYQKTIGRLMKKNYNQKNENNSNAIAENTPLNTIIENKEEKINSEISKKDIQEINDAAPILNNHSRYDKSILKKYEKEKSNIEDNLEKSKKIVAFLCKLILPKEQNEIFLNQEENEKIKYVLDHYSNTGNILLENILRYFSDIHEYDLKNQKGIQLKLDESKKNLEKVLEKITSTFSHGDLFRMDKLANIQNLKSTIETILKNINLIEMYSNIQFEFDFNSNPNEDVSDSENFLYDVNNHICHFKKSVEEYLKFIENNNDNIIEEIEKEKSYEVTKKTVSCLKTAVDSTKVLLEIFNMQVQSLEKLNDLRKFKYEKDFKNDIKFENKNKILIVNKNKVIDDNKIKDMAQNKEYTTLCDLENKKCDSVKNVLIKFLYGNLNKSIEDPNPYSLLYRLEFNNPNLENEEYINEFEKIFKPEIEKIYEKLETRFQKIIDKKTFCKEIIKQSITAISKMYKKTKKFNDQEIKFTKNYKENFMMEAQLDLFEGKNEINNKFMSSFLEKLIQLLVRRSKILGEMYKTMLPEYFSNINNNDIPNRAYYNNIYYKKTFSDITSILINAVVESLPTIHENTIKEYTNNIIDNTCSRDEFAQIKNDPKIKYHLTKEIENANNTSKINYEKHIPENKNDLNIKPIQKNKDININNPNKIIEPNQDININKICNLDNKNLIDVINDNNSTAASYIYDNKLLYKDFHLNTIAKTISKDDSESDHEYNDENLDDQKNDKPLFK